jgi:hypothetical protein
LKRQEGFEWPILATFARVGLVFASLFAAGSLMTLCLSDETKTAVHSVEYSMVLSCMEQRNAITP